MNTYKAQVKIGSGLQWIELTANSLSHARSLFEGLYGKGNVNNVCQAH